MKNQQDYRRDIAEIRFMMERSSKFLSLSGWAGIMAGIYALAGLFIAYNVFGFNPDVIDYNTISTGSESFTLTEIITTAVLVLISALATAIYFSWKKAKNIGEKIWNATSRQMLTQMAVPLVTGGILIIVLILKNLVGLIAPLTLIFYGLALFNAARFTILEVKFLWEWYRLD